MHTRAKLVIRAVGLLLFAGLVATSADAQTSNVIMLQAASGHPQLTSGIASWDSEWSTSGAFNITDGRSVRTIGSSRVWDTPIPITATGVTWRAIAYSTAGNAAATTNRICAFCGADRVDNGVGGTCAAVGQFASCGGSVRADGTSVSLVPVPINGNAYSQSTLGVSTPPEDLVQIKAFQ
jgi:hypothetical protein